MTVGCKRERPDTVKEQVTTLKASLGVDTKVDRMLALKALKLLGVKTMLLPSITRMDIKILLVTL